MKTGIYAKAVKEALGTDETTSHPVTSGCSLTTMAAATAAPAPAVVASVPNTSGITVLLHPLVIVNVSDHYIRRRAQANPPEPNPMGTT